MESTHSTLSTDFRGYIDRVWCLTSVECVENLVRMNLQFAFRGRSKLFFYNPKQLKTISNCYKRSISMGRKYYRIDENAARQAQSIWSLTDYVHGSKTEEYKRLVDKAYDLADQVAEGKPDRV